MNVRFWGVDVQAQEAFRAAERAASNACYEEAVEQFTLVLQLAPREYTLCMRSLLGRRDAYFALGERSLGGKDSRHEFLWGRGARWPGWYIIALIMFRNEIVRGS
jgi:hypothetical protein